jgi:hypothetical protein
MTSASAGDGRLGGVENPWTLVAVAHDSSEDGSQAAESIL